jgi:hypothetical protein
MTVQTAPATKIRVTDEEYKVYTDFFSTGCARCFPCAASFPSQAVLSEDLIGKKERGFPQDLEVIRQNRYIFD